MKVAHVLPLYSATGIDFLGGGERYAYRLARALTRHCEVTFITFGPRPAVRYVGAMRHITVRAVRRGPANPIPLSLRFATEFDVVHAYQPRTIVTSLLALRCSAGNQPLVVTDLGGGGRSPMDRLRLYSLIPRFISISDYSRALLPGAVRPRTHVVKGGVDTAFFSPSDAPRREEVLIVARIMPHKGINYLIDAVGADIELTVAGRLVDKRYFAYLRQLADGKKVTFLLDPTDVDIRDRYRRAAVTVSASVYRDVYGRWQPQSELLGLTLLESMAVGTPVVCTRVGGMPEYVVNRRTGLIVEPNNSAELRNALLTIIRDKALAAQLAHNARTQALAFSWDQVAYQVIRHYGALN